MTHPRDFPFHELSVEERLLLVKDIWASIAADTESLSLTDEQAVMFFESEVAFDVGIPAKS